MRTLAVGTAKLTEWANNPALTWMASLQPLRKHITAAAGPMKRQGCCGKGRKTPVGIPAGVFAQILSDRRFQTDMRTLKQQLRMDTITVRVAGESLTF